MGWRGGLPLGWKGGKAGAKWGLGVPFLMVFFRGLFDLDEQLVLDGYMSEADEGQVFKF